MRFANNLIRATLDPFRFEGDAGGIAFAGNVSSFAPPPRMGDGVRRDASDFASTRTGLLYLAGSDAGAPRDLTAVTRGEAGPAWYPKPAPTEPFAGGPDVAVAPGDLGAAIAAAPAGATLRLRAGAYRLAVPAIVARPVTIHGPQAARIGFTGTTAFQLAEGGSLRIEGVTVSGADAPRRAGNAVVRASATPTIANYTVLLDNVTIRDLGHATGFDVVATAPATFAERIDVRGARISDVTGSVVAAASERGDRGLYPAELVRVTGSTLANVARIVDVARLGTDESTFGPTVEITDNRVGGGRDPAVRLSGVQRATITGNRFADAGGIAVAHGVGFPVTTIRCNTLAGTPAPRVTQLYPQGRPTLTLETAPCAPRS